MTSKSINALKYTLHNQEQMQHMDATRPTIIIASIIYLFMLMFLFVKSCDNCKGDIGTNQRCLEISAFIIILGFILFLMVYKIYLSLYCKYAITLSKYVDTKKQVIEYEEGAIVKEVKMTIDNYISSDTSCLVFIISQYLFDPSVLTNISTSNVMDKYDLFDKYIEMWK